MPRYLKRITFVVGLIVLKSYMRKYKMQSILQIERENELMEFYQKCIANISPSEMIFY